LIVRFPRRQNAGAVCDVLTSPVDILPTLCGLCGIESPRVHGHNLANTWIGENDTVKQDALFTFYIDDAYLTAGMEWRGVRTKKWNYFRFLNGCQGLYNIEEDPFQMNNLMLDARFESVVRELENRLSKFMIEWNDDFKPATTYRSWFRDRTVIRNTFGNLSDPLNPSDSTLL
jgi:arylsulfatase A-like enzyme